MLFLTLAYGLLLSCFLFPGTFGVPCGYLTGINILPRYPEGTRKVPGKSKKPGRYLPETIGKRVKNLYKSSV